MAGPAGVATDGFLARVPDTPASRLTTLTDPAAYPAASGGARIPVRARGGIRDVSADR